MNKKLILVINPGSTSTKVALFDGNSRISEKTVKHDAEFLSRFTTLEEQFEFRRDAVVQFLSEENAVPEQLCCVMARGGMLKPLAGGTYLVTDAMCEDLRTSRYQHASNLGAIIAKDIADPAGIKAFIADPIIVDELDPLARISGVKGIERTSLFHALNQKARARLAAGQMNMSYEEGNFIVAHMGGGITVGAHEKGRVIDVNNALEGDGAFTPERSGSLPAVRVIDLCFDSGLTRTEIQEKIVGKGGLVSYLGTNDGVYIAGKIGEGDERFTLIFEAMAYQVAKEIGSCAAVLKGKVDAVIITGGLAQSDILVKWISERVAFIAKIFVFPGEGEMEALAEAGLRVLDGEPAMVYE